MNYRRLYLPEEVASEEIIHLRFIEDSAERIRIKTKTLSLFDLVLDDQICTIVGRSTAPLETRSIFKYGEKYHEYFDSLKIFIDKIEKQAGKVALPYFSTKSVAGYDS